MNNKIETEFPHLTAEDVMKLRELFAAFKRKQDSKRQLT